RRIPISLAVELRALKRRKRRAPLVASPSRCVASQNSIPRHVHSPQGLWLTGRQVPVRSTFGCSADYKSAIGQITNQRCEAALCAKHNGAMIRGQFARITLVSLFW